MATNDIWQVVLSGNYMSVPITNVFWYEETGNTTPGAAEKAALAFSSAVAAPIATMLHELLVFTDIVATNWSSGLDQKAIDVNIVGNASLQSDPMPSFVTFSWKLPKPAPLYSAGGKRFAGVSEIYVDGNIENIPSQELIDTRAALIAPLNNQGFFARPVVLVTQLNKQPLNTKMGQPPFTTWAVTDAQFRGVSSQRSRLRLN